ncbi:MAG: hypothetical protein ACRCYY_07840 [Trueperaceae bacterium]
MASNLESIVATLLEAWNHPEPRQGKKLLEEITVTNFRYIDPHRPTPVNSRDEFLAFLSTFRERVPYTLEQRKLEQHHNVFRLLWQLRKDEHILSTGEFVGELNEQGQITSIISFIDEFFGFQKAG